MKRVTQLVLILLLLTSSLITMSSSPALAHESDYEGHGCDRNLRNRVCFEREWEEFEERDGICYLYHWHRYGHWEYLVRLGWVRTHQDLRIVDYEMWNGPCVV